MRRLTLQACLILKLVGLCLNPEDLFIELSFELAHLSCVPDIDNLLAGALDEPAVGHMLVQLLKILHICQTVPGDLALLILLFLCFCLVQLMRLLRQQ